MPRTKALRAEGQKLKNRCIAQRRRGAEKDETKDIIKGAARGRAKFENKMYRAKAQRRKEVRKKRILLKALRA